MRDVVKIGVLSVGMVMVIIGGERIHPGLGVFVLGLFCVGLVVANGGRA